MKSTPSIPFGTRVGNELQRVFEVFVAPAAAFRSLEPRPPVLVAIILCGVCQLGLTVNYFAPRLDGGHAVISYMLALIIQLFPILVIATWICFVAMTTEAPIRGELAVSLTAYSTLAAMTITYVWALIETLLDVNNGRGVPYYSNLEFLITDPDNLVGKRIAAALNFTTLYKFTLISIGVAVLRTGMSRTRVIVFLWAGLVCLNGVAVVIKYIVTH